MFFNSSNNFKRNNNYDYSNNLNERLRRILFELNDYELYTLRSLFNENVGNSNFTNGYQNDRYYGNQNDRYYGNRYSGNYYRNFNDFGNNRRRPFNNFNSKNSNNYGNNHTNGNNNFTRPNNRNPSRLNQTRPNRNFSRPNQFNNNNFDNNKRYMERNTHRNHFNGNYRRNNFHNTDNNINHQRPENTNQRRNPFNYFNTNRNFDNDKRHQQEPRQNHTDNQQFTKPKQFQKIPVRKLEKVINNNKNQLNVKGTCWNYNTGNDLKFRKPDVTERVKFPFLLRDIKTPEKFSDDQWAKISPLLNLWKEMLSLYLNHNRLKNHGVLVNVCAKVNLNFLSKYLDDINNITETKLRVRMENEIAKLDIQIRQNNDLYSNLAAMKIATSQFKKFRKFNIWEFYPYLNTLMIDTFNAGISLFNQTPVNILVQNVQNIQNNLHISNNGSQIEPNNQITPYQSQQNLMISQNNNILNNNDYESEFPPLCLCRCPFCNYESSSGINAFQHLERCLRNNFIVNAKCNYCDHQFINHNDAATHIKAHWDFQLNGSQLTMG